MSDKGYSLAFGYLETDVGEHFAVGIISEMDVVEGDLLLKDHRLRLLGLDDVGLGVEYGIDTLEGRESAADTVGGFAEVLGGVDDGVEDNEVIDERRCIYRRMIGEDEQAAEPEDDRDERCAEELGERVGKVVTAVDTVEGSTCGIDEGVETRTEFVLRIKTLDDTQAEQGLIDRREDLGVLFLPLGGRFLEAPSDAADKEDCYRHEDEHEEGELPRDDKKGDEIDDNHHRIFEEDIERRHNGRLDLVDVVGHTRDDVAAAGFGEIAHRQGEDLIVELLAQVAQDTRTDRHHEVVRQPRRCTLEAGHNDEEEAQHEQDVTRTMERDLVVEDVVEVGT